MGSGWRMCRIQLLLLSVAVVSTVISLTDASALEVMSAPNVLRVGTAQNIFVEIQDYEREDDVAVQLAVISHPTKTKHLAVASLTLSKETNYQGFGTIKIPAEQLSRDPDMKQYVYLQARFPGRILEKVVLVSFHSGSIFIQTDKTVYTPESEVLYRIFGMNPGMGPMTENDRTDSLVDVKIVTPEGIALPDNSFTLGSRITQGRYGLPEMAGDGLWKVVANFRSNPQETFAAEFEVKKHVPPSFQVELTPSSSFFYVDSEALTVNIKTTYTFGQEVVGTAYAVFGVVENDYYKRGFPSSSQKVPIVEGKGEVKLTREHITQTFPNMADLAGHFIFVAVSVLTESGGEMVEAELKGIMITASPYTIHFTKSSGYFKPGMPYDVTIQVVNPDNSPAAGVAVVVDPGNMLDFTSTDGVAKFPVNTAAGAESISVTARTNDPLLPPPRKASASMIARSYKTKSSNYLLINVFKTDVVLGDFMKVKLFLSRAERQRKDITYLILSRGQLVSYGRRHIGAEVFVSLTLPITKELLPSFRIVAYYHPNSDEVVSDSVWVDVKDSCVGSLKLESVRPAPSYGPRSMFHLRITGDPGARVGLVAADKSTYVLNKLHLTQKKIWDTVEKFDTGCTPGGGRDGMGVFYDAGLLFETSNMGTPERTDFRCPTSSRRKRAITIMDLTNSLVSQFDNKEARECCLDGLREIPVSYTCERRSEYIGENPACMAAFINCCRELAVQRAESGQETGSPVLSQKEAQGEEDDGYKFSDLILTRTRFQESWLWLEVGLDACPPGHANCGSTSLVRTVPLPESVTSWLFTGISVSPTHGICVSEPLEVKVHKHFFIDLKLPYSAVIGEQLEIKAILHNYSPDPIAVYVQLEEETSLCSKAYKRGWHRKIVKVGPQTTLSVPFIVIPLKEGNFPVNVKAAVKDSTLDDGIRRMLRVVPAGILVKSVKSVILNPAQNGVDGKQVTTISSEIPAADVVPNTHIITVISLTGSRMSPLLGKVMSGDSMENLIIGPLGSAEANMIGMTLPVSAVRFLDQTNQWEDVGFKKRDKALEYILKGYQKELDSRKGDGSFSELPHNTGSTWLTAYVAKVFSMIHDLVPVQPRVICDAIKFLILHAQRSNGMFNENSRVFDTTMIGDVYGLESDASMTAFCVIALQESRPLCAATVNSLPLGIERSVAYLEQRLPSLTNPYAVAMTSYALANENKLNQQILFKFAALDQSHWPVRKGHLFSLEATAYALLALVKAEAFEKAEPVARWLNEQQRLNGGFGSTQATITVYQAVAEYWTRAKSIQYGLNVDILLPDRTRPDRYHLNRENQQNTRTSKFKGINKDVIVTATGTGEAVLKMVSHYYTLPREESNNCEKFNLSVQVLPERNYENKKTYKLKIEVLHKVKERDSSLSILEVGLPTGFTFNKNDLDSLSTGRARVISKFDAVTVLAEKGSITIYLDKISNRRPEEISFRIHQEMKVGNLKPAAVSVYEYYDRRWCAQFYQPEKSEDLMTLCHNGLCLCAEENCAKQRKEKVSQEVRLAKSCENTPGSKVDFVYKVSVEGLTDGTSADIYTMRITELIKEVHVDVTSVGQLRSFLGDKRCRDHLDLKPGKTYLIMGQSGDIHKYQQSTKYVLGERTWIEYWPGEAECQTAEHGPTCAGMSELAEQHSIFGCQI